MKPQIFQGIVPVNPSQILPDIIAGITLATLSIPEVMGYTKIAGTPVITGLYTILLPIAVFALLGSSRHLVVGADSAGHDELDVDLRRCRRNGHPLRQRLQFRRHRPRPRDRPHHHHCGWRSRPFVLRAGQHR